MRLFMSIFILLYSSFGGAKGFFQDGISYFEDRKKEVVPRKQNMQDKRKEKPGPSKFNWATYLDPNSDEFFKEGSYIPPKPFLEAIRRPTKHNINMYEKWKSKKDQLLKRFIRERARHIGKMGLPKKEGLNLGNLKRYKMVFYFSSTCSACKGMFATINQMVMSGVYVEAVRVDNEMGSVEGLRIPWSQINNKERKYIKPNVVPLLVAYELKGKKAFKITGKKSLEEISSILSNASRKI